MNQTTARPHFSDGLVDFLRDLEKNNNKAWFEANRETYRDVYVTPTLHLIEAMTAPLAKLQPPLNATPKINGSLRRINRDVRFSKDKRPYAPMLHLIFPTGERANHGPGIHVVVATDHWGIGGGHWAFGPAELEAYRKAVTTKTGADGLLKSLATAKKVDCVPDEPQLARVPRGYDAEEPVATMLRRKGMVVRSHDLAIPDALFGPGAIDYMLARIRGLMPLIGWLDRNVYSRR